MAARRKFTRQFRRELAQLVIQTGQSISDVAWDNGVSERLLSKWVKLERERTGLPRYSGS